MKITIGRLLFVFVLFYTNIALAAQLKVTVEGMTCGSCVKKLSAHIRQKPGVTEATVDLENKLLTMTVSDPAPANELVTGWVSELGYTVTAIAVEAQNSSTKGTEQVSSKK